MEEDTMATGKIVRDTDLERSLLLMALKNMEFGSMTKGLSGLASSLMKVKSSQRIVNLYEFKF
jgi:hypothetical protein